MPFRAFAVRNLIAIAAALFLIVLLALWVRAPHDKQIPKLILWAWEVPEDLRSIDTSCVGVAYYIGILNLEHGRTNFTGRHNALLLPKGGYRIPVVRIETRDSTPGTLSPKAIQAIAITFANLADTTSGIQIDFDARTSDRRFYAALIDSVHAHLGGRPLTITALASWCISDLWIDSLPIDDAIPMLFRMGPDDRTIRSYLNSGGTIRSVKSQRSIGISTDEVLPSFPRGRKLFVFNPRPWTKESINHAMKLLEAY